jgi:hypothetical protein
MTNDVIGRLIADKYRVEGLIAERETGDLYIGRHEILDLPVTLKVLSPALAIDGRWVKNFVNEARAASAVTHPNVLAISDFGTDAKSVSYAVYEEIKGRTLSELIAKEPSLDEQRSIDIARQVASAVAAAHEKKILHGRLDPRSVFIDGYETGNDLVKVLGFGSDPLTVPRDADPRYLAPEQCNAFPAADERSDVYAIGIMLYEMLSGGVPYDGKTPADVLSQQTSEPPAPLSAFRRDLHPDIEPIILSAIAADPEHRYQSVESFAEDLGVLHAKIGGKANVETLAAAPGRNVWQTAFVVLAGISLLAVALIYATSVRQTDPTAQLQADVGSLPVQPIGPATGAQEESLARLPALTDAEIMQSAAMQQMQSDLPGGDGYNPWANGGAPPPGAPLNSQVPPVGYVPPGGQVYTIDPSTGSQFMPPDGGVILVPVPVNTNTAVKPSPTPKTPASNTAVPPEAAASPKPLATPPPKTERTPAKPAPDKPDSAAGSSKSGNAEDSE